MINRPPPRFRPDFEGAAARALELVGSLSAGLVTFGEVETALLPFLAGPDWVRVDDARRAAANFVVGAVTIEELTGDA